MHLHIHSDTQKHVILIAFPQQQLLHEHTSMLRCTYTASLVELYSHNSLAEYEMLLEIHQKVT
jgi:hypothetical protein